MNLLQNKTALITGGAKGIGEAVVRAFVLQGAQVVFTYHHSEETAQILVNELGEDHVKAIHCDVTNTSSILEVVQNAYDHLGRIDILVNNAGRTKDNLVLRMSEEDWDEVMDTNLKSIFLFSKHALRFMVRTGGSIINLSSVMGLYGNAGQANYAASKAGVVGLSKSLAYEYGSRKVRCNVVAPGWIDTEMTQSLSDDKREGFEKSVSLKRIGTPQEVADSIVFLASDMSSYITGQVLQICGGLKS